ncbi:DUF2690 domain-containing protein [Streptomyces caelestis]
MSATMPWKPLPDTLGPECLRFVTRMRELKDDAGVSLTVLAERTAYSRSSWDRCLNGRALPPRQAVEGLCRLAGQPAGPLLALWELAELTRGGRPPGSGTPAGGTPAAEETERTDPDRAVPARTQCTEKPGPARPTPPRRAGEARRHHSRRAVAVTAALVAAATLPLTWWLTDAAGGPALLRPAVAVTAQPLCTGSDCRGEDPRTTWCAGGSESVVRKRLGDGVSFEIRYREACRAAWGRMWFSRPGDRLVLTLPGERTDVTDTAPEGADRYHSTPMLTTDTPREVTACYLPERGTRVCIGGRSAASLMPAGDAGGVE